MRNYSRYITLAGGLLAFFSFVFPWVDSYSGVELAIGGFHPISVILIILIALIGFGIFCSQSISRALGIILVVFGILFFIIIYSIFVDVDKYFDHGSSIITIAFFMSFIIIGSSLMLNQHGSLHSFARSFVLTKSAVGIICFMIVVFSLKLDLKIVGSLNTEIKYGAFLAAIGFILSIVGALETPYWLENDDSNIEENQSDP